MREKKREIALLLALSLILGGCGTTQSAGKPSNTASGDSQQTVYAQEDTIEDVQIQEEAVALSEGTAAVSSELEAKATGTSVEKNDKCLVDYSNTSQGYIMVKYTQSTSKKLKCQVTGPDKVTYTYNLTVGRYEVFPLTAGNGTYKIAVFQNVTGTSYCTVLSMNTKVELKDKFLPFLSPNQYVNYTSKTKVVKKAATLTKNTKAPLKKVKIIYNYVIKNYSYDKKKAKNVQSGYLPDLDKIYAAKKGICFDYAAMMTAMLRSQNIPSKLVIGYAGDAYHAWINVYTKESGWVDGVIFFNGTTWKLMDPTFASTGNSSKEVMKYIGNGKNYEAKYIY